MKRVIRILTLLLVAGAPAALSGCFLFSGDDDKSKGSEAAAMDATGAPRVDAAQNTPPSPWRSIELKDDGGPSGGSLLPIVAIVLSLISLGLVIVYGILHRRRRVAPPV